MTTRVEPQLSDPTNGIGYTPGVGASVTQTTSKSTAVTLNKPCGKITMNNATLNAGATVEFVLNNNLLTQHDMLLLNVDGFTNYRAEVRNVTAGAAAIRVTNTSGGNLSEAVAINFALIKGATS